MLGTLLLFHSTFFEICVYFLLLAYKMKGNKSKQIKEDARELEKGVHLVKSPLSIHEEFGLTLPMKAEKMNVKVSISKQQKEHSTKD